MFADVTPYLVNTQNISSQLCSWLSKMSTMSMSRLSQMSMFAWKPFSQVTTGPSLRDLNSRLDDVAFQMRTFRFEIYNRNLDSSSQSNHIHLLPPPKRTQSHFAGPTSSWKVQISSLGRKIVGPASWKSVTLSWSTTSPALDVSRPGWARARCVRDLRPVWPQGGSWDWGAVQGRAAVDPPSLVQTAWQVEPHKPIERSLTIA